MSRASDIWDVVDCYLDNEFEKAELFLDILLACEYIFESIDDYRVNLSYTNTNLEEYYNYIKNLPDNRKDWEFLELYEKQ